MSERLPEWAEFFESINQLERFQSRVIADFEGRGMRVAVEDGWVLPTKPSGNERWGLSNVGQKCAAAEEGEWAQIVAEHFDAVLDPANRELSGRMGDFEWVRERLRLRIWDPEVQWLEGVCAWENIPGLATVLFIDLERVLQAVRDEDAAKWGVPMEDVFEIALQNTLEELEPQIETMEHEGRELMIVSANSAYTTTFGLVLDDFEGAMGEQGAIVAMPTRDSLLASRFDSVGDLVKVNATIFIAHGAFRDGPNSLTPRVYWYRGDGEWHEIRYEMSEDGLKVVPSPDVVELLNGLAAG